MMQAHESPPQSNTLGTPPSETLVTAGSVGDTDEGKSHCQWTDVDEEELVQFLVDQKATAGDGANFKKVTWTAAAAHMRNITTKGAVKTLDACKSKWNRVKRSILCLQCTNRVFTVA
jgi:hypothetical protein